MKTGIITFHASHNYGSMLQAYALQQTVMSLGHQCEIINFRTERQRRTYRPFFRRAALQSKIKALLFPGAAIGDIRRHRLFEQFLNSRFILSPKEYTTLEQLQEAQLPYDAIISGSDQIWNTFCFDHDRAYFLPFAADNCRKIAYAPSMGPNPDKEVRSEFENQICTDLKSYSAISVREEATAVRIESITGQRPDVVLDPTLLLKPEQWLSLDNRKPLYSSDYILLYTPIYCDSIYIEADRLSKKFHLPVVITIESCAYKWTLRHGFKLINAVGPVEFINLIRNARLVVSGSFHAAVFSLLFDRQLYAFDGMNDARVSNILSLTGLQQLADSPESLADPADIARTYADARQRLEPLRQQSLQFLAHGLRRSRSVDNIP